MSALRYPQLDNIEDIEGYCPGGFHPVSVGDVLAGRYEVLHKLGFGGSSTVWLARDYYSREDLGSLVALKTLSAEQSSKPTTEIPDIYILAHVSACLQAVDHPGRRHLSIINNYFSHTGPNGSHLCLISQFAGGCRVAGGFEQIWQEK